jgi:pyruvate ferredoxin oxidoreductase delta subunit
MSKELKNMNWNEVSTGAVLFSFEKAIEDIAHVPVEERPYSVSNSHKRSVGDWRVEKPVYNREFCIDCQFCWIFCPDSAIISKNKKMMGIDYDHCKGCGICVEVCPTNPKSLLMFVEQTSEEEALANWPKKESKK